jgi:hypothetical protein
VGGSAIGQSRLTSAYGFGVALLLSGISLQATTRVQDGFEATHSLGLEVDVTEWARMRAGAACEPGRFACGLGIGTSLWPSVDLAWQWHPKLGGSTFVSVVLRL